MKPFSKNEAIGVILILLFTFSVTFYNLRISVRRSRDVQRRSDLGVISDAILRFQEGFGYFPPSRDGKIKMCKGDNFDEVVATLRQLEEFDRNLFFEGLRGCDWGKDSFRDLTDETYEPYLKLIPKDPREAEGLEYYYISNTNRFQIYSYLEGEEAETGFNIGVVKRNLPCGQKTCNFGKSSGDTPVDMSIDEYERQLKEKGAGN